MSRARGQRGEALKEAELMGKMTKGLLHACTGLLIQEAEMKRVTKGSTSVNVNGAALAERMQGYNCGELGHIKPHCKKSMKQDTRKCYACGGKGHIGDVCPSMRNRDDEW